MASCATCALNVTFSDPLGLSHATACWTYGPGWEDLPGCETMSGGGGGGSNPADLCSDPSFAISHAQCGSPIGLPTSPFPPLGGIGGEGGGIIFGGASSSGHLATLGDAFRPLYSCLTPNQIKQLESDLLELAGEAIGAKLTGGGNGNPVIGGAWNVYQKGTVYVDQQVVNAAQPADPVEHQMGYQKQLIVPLHKGSMPGPGNVMHILFNTGGTNAAGQVAITQLKVHADIAGQGGLNDIPHGVFDLGLARLSSTLGGGCPVKLY